MKRFIVKGIIFFVITALCIEALNWAYLSKDPFKTNRFKNVPDGVELCNVGASQSEYSFNYDDYKDKFVTFNFAMTNQSLVYDLRVIENYRDKLKEGGIMFIEVSYPMVIGRSEIYDGDFAEKNIRYYRFLPNDMIREYNLKSDLRINLISFTITSVNEVLNTIIRKNNEWEWSLVTNVDEAKREANRPFDRIVKNNIVDKSGHTVFLQEAIDSIYGLIKLCREEGVTPILITTPLTAAFDDLVRKKESVFYDDFYNAIAEIQKNTGVEYYNYSRDERFCKSYEKFLNSDHLNKVGAREFTNILMEEVVKDRIKHDERGL